MLCMARLHQSCLTLCDPMDCSSPGSSVHRIPQTRILEWVAITFSSGFAWPKDRTWISYIADRFFTVWATREAPSHQGSPKCCGFPKLTLYFLDTKLCLQRNLNALSTEKNSKEEREPKSKYCQRNSQKHNCWMTSSKVSCVLDPVGKQNELTNALADCSFTQNTLEGQQSRSWISSSFKNRKLSW